MATYKVIQDIEAEDKILGPLTLRQFIYALITAFLLYICFICVSRGAAYLLAIFLPPALFMGFFAFPFGRDQPTEVWALAKVRFLFKPRKRVWDQSGVKELVTINVPKKVEVIRTNGLSQSEVQSRLKALAATIDSRGWAVKNVNVNLYDPTAQVNPNSSDRLLSVNSIPQQVPSDDIQASDDMLDEVNNPIAQQFDHLINDKEKSHRQELINELNNPEPPKPQDAAPKQDDYWFLNQPAAPSNMPASQAMFDGARVVQPGSDDTAAPAQKATPDEDALAAQLKAKNQSNRQLYHSHLRTIQPLGSQPAAEPADDDMAAAGDAAAEHADDRTPSDAPADNAGMAAADGADAKAKDTSDKAATPSTPQHDPAILSLANNNDLNVATLAREAYKAKNGGESPDEVVISLH